MMQRLPIDYIKLIQIMLCWKDQYILERHEGWRIDNPLAHWCRQNNAEQSRQKQKARLGAGREKVSIKQLKRSCKASKPLYRSEEVISPAAKVLLNSQRGFQSYNRTSLPVLNFTYLKSSTQIRHQPQPQPFQVSQLSCPPALTRIRHQSPNFPSQQSSQQIKKTTINDLQKQPEAPSFHVQDQLAKTVKKKASLLTREKPINDQFAAEPLVAKMNTDNNSNEFNRLLKSEPLQRKNEKNQQQEEEQLNKPSTKTFERGSLFKSVRKSQTINNDAKSDSSAESIVIADYKSMMSKIQEQKHEEEQEFSEI